MSVTERPGPAPAPEPASGAAARRRIADEVGSDRLRPLLARSNRPGLRLLAVHTVALAAGALAVAAARGTWWIWAAWVADGIVIAHLFALQHETAHATAFTGRRANRVISAVCGASLGIAPTFFRFEHTAHHAWTQDSERDPEMLEVPGSILRWVWAVGGGPFWIYQVRTLVPHALGRFAPSESFVPASARRRVRTEAVALLAVWAAVVAVPLAAGSHAVVVWWIVPRILGEPMMRIARLSEHAGRPRTPDVAVNTRSLDVPLPLRLLAWNMPYHAEHHAVPAVPFHALPELRELLTGHIEAPRGGYGAAQLDVLRRIRTARL